MHTLLPPMVALLLALLLPACASSPQTDQPLRHSTRTGPLRIAAAGMVHGHVEGLLWAARERRDIELVGIYEPDRAVFDRLAAKYNLDPSLWYPELVAMLDATHPEAVSVMTSIADHRAVADACAPRGVHMLVEKPLAFTADDAHHMAKLARTHGVHILTNYETSWYASIREIHARTHTPGGPEVRKLIFRHGHKGPAEIGCAPEFLAWLTDPAQNGGGALIDFGCYGAVLSTWFMDGQRPLSITASAASLKPPAAHGGLYRRVDDDATIVLTYPHTTAVIQASWNWTHDAKEMDLYAPGLSFHAGKWDALSIRDADQPPRPLTPTPKPPHMENEWTYLTHVIRGQCPVDPLSSLEYNVIVSEILDEARRQVTLTPER